MSEKLNFRGMSGEDLKSAISAAVAQYGRNFVAGTDSGDLDMSSVPAGEEESAISAAIIQVPQAPAAPEKPATSVQEAISPRMTKAIAGQEPGIMGAIKGLPKALGAGALDAVSLPGRALAGIARKPDETYAESVAKTNGEGVLQGALRAPSTLITAPISGPASLAGKALGPVVKAGISGALQGAAAGGIRQAENLEAGEDVELAEVPKEAVISALFGSGGVAAAKGIGAGLKGLGAHTLSSIIRPGHTEGFNINNVFKKYPAMVGAVKNEAGEIIKPGKIKNIAVAANDVPTMRKNVDAIFDKLQVERDKVIEQSRIPQVGKISQVEAKRFRHDSEGRLLPSEVNRFFKTPGVAVNLDDAFKNVTSKFEHDKEHILNKKELDKTLEELMDKVRTATNGTGELPLEYAMKLKTDLGREGAWRATPLGHVADPEATAKEDVYNALFAEVKKAVNKTIEDYNLGDTPIGVINKRYEELIPIKEAIVNREPIAGSNIPLGLSFRDAFLGSLAGISHAMAGGSPLKSLAIGIGGAAASKAAKSGYAGMAERAIGEGLGSKAVERAAQFVPATTTREIYSGIRGTKREDKK